MHRTWRWMGGAVARAAAFGAVLLLGGMARAQFGVINPYEDSTGTVVGLDVRNRCNAGDANDAGCNLDSDCPGSAVVGRCAQAPAQDIVSRLPSSAVRKNGRINCAGTGTAVTLGSGWRPCVQLRITNPLGNDIAHVGYPGVTTSNSRRLEPGTYDFTIAPAADDDCGTIEFLCTSGQQLEVITP